MKNCPICNGAGYVPVPSDPTSRKRCRCTTEDLYRAKLGRDIVDAPKIKNSPYAGLVKKDLFVVANRKDFLPHLRFALLRQGSNFFSRVTNDSAILDAWFSNKKERTREEHGEIEADFTSVVDLVESPSLLIIFLGVLSYPNKAMPGKLLEALRIRSFQNRPTWLVNPHSFPFSSGHLCWSPETNSYIEEHFKEMRIAPSTNWKTVEELDSDGNETKIKPNMQVDGLPGDYL